MSEAELDQAAEKHIAHKLRVNATEAARKVSVRRRIEEFEDAKSERKDENDI
tara:strand:- start:7385 stop:7540 length:156 start_codon:yes stop_codon:yes gene_type:complete